MKKSFIGLVFIAIVLMFIMAGTGYATNISYKATADNVFSAYISDSSDEQGTLIGSGNNWGATYSGSGTLSTGITQYLHIYGYNSGGPASFIGDFTLSDSNFKFANGTQSLLSNTSDWFVSATWYGAGPNVVTSYGNNGVTPWGSHPAISANAKWIWTNNSSGTYAYISTPITATVSPVPLPSAILLLGPGLAGLVVMSKRFKK
jgi:hypothetical protein